MICVLLNFSNNSKKTSKDERLVVAHVQGQRKLGVPVENHCKVSSSATLKIHKNSIFYKTEKYFL